MQHERDVAERAAAKPVDAKQLLAAGVRPAGEVIADLPVRHQSDQLGHGHVRDVACCHVTAIAHHRHTVPDAEHLVHPMRDVDHRDAVRRQSGDGREELRDLALAERRRRLVHDQDARLVGQGARHFDHLLLRDPETAHDRIGIDLDAEARPGSAKASRRIRVQLTTPGQCVGAFPR